MKNLMLHADDFGLSEGVNKGIVELAEQQRISGTAVMTIFNEAKIYAGELKQIKPFDIGLHITLTDQALCHYDTSLVNAAGRAYRKEEVIKKALKGDLSLKDLKKEIGTQIQNFMDIFGRQPDYFDGHHHMQLLKPVRHALYELSCEMGIKNVFIRSSFIPLSFGLSKRNLVLKTLNKDMQKNRDAWGWRSNDFFAGSYGKEGLAEHMNKILSQQKDNLLMMLHPGHVDDLLCARDSLQKEREDEYRFLLSDDLPQLLERYQYRLSYVG